MLSMVGLLSLCKDRLANQKSMISRELVELVDTTMDYVAKNITSSTLDEFTVTVYNMEPEIIK